MSFSTMLCLASLQARLPLRSSARMRHEGPADTLCGVSETSSIDRPSIACRSTLSYGTSESVQLSLRLTRRWTTPGRAWATDSKGGARWALALARRKH